MRNVPEILFIVFKHEISENQFSEFSCSWKTFLLNLISCLINSFIINDVYKNSKENIVIARSKQRKYISCQ